MAKLDIYSRQGCHLCEVLIEQVLELVGDRASVVLHDVDSRPDWQERYGERVPVVQLNGATLCEGRLDAPAVRSALAALQ